MDGFTLDALVVGKRRAFRWGKGKVRGKIEGHYQIKTTMNRDIFVWYIWDLLKGFKA